MDSTYTGQGDWGAASGEYERLEFIARQAMDGMATATLVQVVAVSAETVDVQPLIRQVDGAGNGISHGIIHDMPFFALHAGTARIIARPRKGDIGVAIFCHNDISAVKKARRESNPGSFRRFDWSDGIYFGGVLPSAPATVEMDVTEAGVFVTGSVDVSENLTVGNGATGTFSTPTGQTVTVQNGIIINIA